MACSSPGAQRSAVDRPTLERVVRSRCVFGAGSEGKPLCGGHRRGGRRLALTPASILRQLGTFHATCVSDDSLDRMAGELGGDRHVAPAAPAVAPNA